MNRVGNNLKLDITLQKRYGFFYAAAFVAVVWIIVLRFIPEAWYSMAVPALVFLDMGIIGFYFLAGQVIFEKSEGTLNALVVTPLRFKEYLLSKMITLTVLSWVISMAVAIGTVGLNFNIPMFTLGVVFTSTLILGIGMFAVIPYSSISGFLMPSQLYFLPICLPLIDFMGWAQSAVFFLIPSQACLLLLKGSFHTIAPWQMVYAILYQMIWIFILFKSAEKRFNHHVIAGAAERRNKR